MKSDSSADRKRRRSHKVPFKESVRLTARLFKYVLRHRTLFIFTLLAVGSYAALEGGFFLLIEPFMKAVQGQGTVQQVGASDQLPDHIGGLSHFIKIAYWVLAIAPLISIAGFFQYYLCNKLSWSIVADIRNDICKAILPQSMAFFDKRRSGEFVSRITNDVSFTERALSFLYNDAMLQPLRFLFFLAIALRACWQMEVITLVFFMLVALPIVWLGRYIRRAARRGLEKMAQLTDVMHEMFAGIRLVKAFQMEKQEAEEFQRTNRLFIERVMKMVRAKAISRSFVFVMGFASTSCCMIVASYVIEKDMWGLTWPKFFQFVMVSFMMGDTIRKLTKSYNDLQQALGACDRIFEIVDHEPGIRDEPDAVELTGLNEGISFRDVHFTYDKDEVLHGVSFDVKKGETIALVGRSGAGKSTIMDLVARFYEPSEGQVLVDGIDLKRVKRESLLARIGMVAQQTFLFNRSLADNIRYGRRNAVSQTEIEAAAKAANIHDFIVSLPEGYETEVGEFGVRLSGGQRQRIAIARAILKNAPILILDEAMVGLDSESEKAVRDAIVNLMKDRTTFVIAHDLTTIQHADRILVLKDGNIVEQGTHEELMATQGEYWRLRSLQMGDKY